MAAPSNQNRTHETQSPSTNDQPKPLELNLQTIFNATSEAIFVHDATSHEFIHANKPAEKFYGKTKEELLSCSVSDLSITEAGYTTERAAILWEKTLKEGPQTSEWLAKAANETPLWVEISMNAVVIEDQNCIVVVVRNIDKRKKTENALAKSEERFKLAMEACKDGIWDWDLANNEIYYSPGYAAMIGYTEYEVNEYIDFWESHIHPDDREKVMTANLCCIENLTEYFTTEFRMKAKDGTWHWILGRGKAVKREPSGRALRMVGTHTDITKTHSDAQAMNAFFEQSMNLHIIADLDGIIECINESWEKIFQYKRDELEGSPFINLVHPDDIEATLTQMEMLKHGKAVDYFENRYKCKDGSYRTLAWSATASTQEQRIYATANDISERKETQQKLLEQFHETERFNKMAVDRELRMIELKKEVNKLNRDAGKKEPYAPNSIGENV